MDIDVKDTLILSDDNRYVVVSKAYFEDSFYYYLIDERNPENVKFCVEKSDKKLLVEIEDKEQIKRLLPFFLKSTSNAITKEELALMQQE